MAASDPKPKTHLYAIIDYQDAYVQPLILNALKSILQAASQPVTFVPLSTIWDPSQSSSTSTATGLTTCHGNEPSIQKAIPSPIPSTSCRILQITPYEAIDFEFALSSSPSSSAGRYVVNSYMLRKALIRKHYLASTVANWAAKRPESILGRNVKVAEGFEVDYAEFLDDALVECFDLRASLEKNEMASLAAAAVVVEEGKGDSGDGAERGGNGHESQGHSGLLPPQEREWWILKPSMSDRGQGIKLFSTMQELQDIFDDWEAGAVTDGEDDQDEGENPSSPSNATTVVQEEKGDDNKDAEEYDADHDDNITAAHLRHFVAQPYIHPPLLVPGDSRKFHIRTYVVCIGALKVYVYKPMLMLFAAKPYLPPWECVSGRSDVENFLTNTCLQANIDKSTLVESFWDSRLPEGQKSGIFGQICDITGELFEAAAKGMMMHFQPMEDAFEVFGLDFLVDARGTAWLLEVNSFPDFKQTGGDLGWIVAELWKAVLSLIITPFIRTGSEPMSGNDDGHKEQKDRDSESQTTASMTAAAEDHHNLVCVKEVDLGKRFTS